MGKGIVDEGSPISRRGNEVTFRREDGSTFTRTLTPREQAVTAVIDRAIKEDLHGVGHRVDALLAADDAEEIEAGIEALRAEFPGWIEVASCDDDHFCSSDLVLVRHGTGDNYMGIRVAYLPQVAGEPATFFLYPKHARSLLAALRAVGDEATRSRIAPEAPFDADVETE